MADKSNYINNYLIFLIFNTRNILYWGFPGDSDGKASPCNAEDPGSIPGSARSPGERNGNPLQYSCIKTPMERGAQQAIVHGVMNESGMA